MSQFDAERVSKISQIMPQFSKVAQKGDKVLMGLEGDPKFPSDFKKNRPMATISNIEVLGDDEYNVKLSMEDGTTKTVNSLSLSARDVWEFSDESFRNVMNREKEKMTRAEANIKSSTPEYRGSNNDVMELKNEISQLKSELAAERATSRSFHNTMIASMHELANDICKMDTSGNAEFCKVFRNEYTKMMKARGESSLDNIDYRGLNIDDGSDMDSIPSHTASPVASPVRSPRVNSPTNFSDSDSDSGDSDFF